MSPCHTLCMTGIFVRNMKGNGMQDCAPSMGAYSIRTCQFPSNLSSSPRYWRKGIPGGHMGQGSGILPTSETKQNRTEHDQVTYKWYRRGTPSFCHKFSVGLELLRSMIEKQNSISVISQVIIWPTRQKTVVSKSVDSIYIPSLLTYGSMISVFSFC